MISAGLWQRAEELFHRALPLPEDERAELIRATRALDPEVCSLVVEMLAEADPGDLDSPSPHERHGENDTRAPPDQIGEYRIVREIGRGGMGIVYEAIQPRLDRIVALKVLRVGGASQDDRVLRSRFMREARRFRDEAQVLGLLDHPGVVPILDLDETADGVAYFTMRRVAGDDFREVMRQARERTGGWNPTRALSVLQRVCETLAFAHHRGIVHRDIKPSNLMTGSFGEVYVIDWGLARVLNRGANERGTRPEIAATESAEVLETLAGDVIGTPSYMSPEQALGRSDQMGPRSDVYSVGAVLYELLDGHPPHWRVDEANDSLTILERVRRGNPPRLLPRRDVIPALAAICDKAMAQRPEDRYESAEALGKELDAYLSNRVVHAYRTGAFAELRMWCVRNRLLAITLCAALGIVAFAAVRLSLLNRDLRAERDDFFRVATAHELVLASEELEELWPLDEERIEPLENWLRQAERLEADLRDHRARLAAVRARALPWTADEQRRDRETHPDYARVLLLEEEIAATPAKIAIVSKRIVEPPRDDLEIQGNLAARGAIDRLESKLETSKLELAQLRESIAIRRTWRFETREDVWWQEQLARLVHDLERFVDAEHGAIQGLSPIHGMGARQRLEFAKSIAARTRDGEEAQRAWSMAIDAIADVKRCPAYRGMHFEPQLGLLPLGIDPHSKLFEFWHPLTGERPERDAEGRLIITEASSLVFVLIPSGRFLLGAQSSDPNGPNFDPDADLRGDEGHSDGRGIREVEVAPFLLSKYEMTSAQWRRVVGQDPSVLAMFSNGAETVDGRHPVENVPFDLAVEWMRRMDLSLPSEIQWEYACRAGTNSPRWWDGVEADAARLANLADRRMDSADLAGSGLMVAEWDDGFAVHAPVGSFPPNPFGLHECLGNVMEWCSNRYTKAGYTIEGTEPLHRHTPLKRVARGGSYGSPARDVRASNRFPFEPDALRYTGLRPSREVRSPEVQSSETGRSK